jgi:uncharacterized protein (TIGR03437 family)
MKRIVLFSVWLLLVSLPSAAQQPTIAANGVVNGASYARPGFPNGGIAQGSIFTIFGDNLGPANYVQVDTFPLPTSAGLAGTRVTVTVGSTTLDAIMLWTLKTQVAAVLPSNTPLGQASVRVIYNGQTSNAVPITVVARSFGTFAVNQAGSGPGVIFNFNTEADQPLNAGNRPARPGQTLVLWGTGIGAVTGNEAGSPLPNQHGNVNLKVFVGAEEAPIAYKGRSGCCVGIDQVVFNVPSNVSGCNVPVHIVVDGVVSNFTSIAVAASGNTCSNTASGGYSNSDIDLATANGGLRIANILAQRFFMRSTIQLPIPIPLPTRLDSLNAVYAFVPLATILNAPPGPPMGSCTVLQIPGPLFPNNTPLNAGQVSATGPVGPRTLIAQGPGSWFINFQPGGFPANGTVTDGTLVTAGTYNFTAVAGSDVGAHSASVNHPASFNWTQHQTVSTNISRSQAMTFNWTGGSPGGIVVITLASLTQATPSAVGAQIACAADATAGSFTVPASFMSALPPTGSEQGFPLGSLAVINLTFGGQVSIPGVDRGYTNAYDTFNVGPVNFQ